ncbi:MAG TPA: CcoQ/FixQ family Cbb3-type cytochrome c oxidase assembly chaperone [Chitinophagaceae bacterium]|nr:CcoQ/FixQ family Cbb3-type cytochrome c oxidase assembly chaperone [Chitinophagaceae bacterium]
MKFTNYLEKISGVSIYPIISLLLFVLFFVSVTIWAFRINQKEIDEMANIPLED